MPESDLANNAQPSPGKRGFNFSVRFGLEEVLFLSLIGLSLFGVALTHVSPTLSFWYWIAMVPVFASIALATEWSRARREGQSAASLIMVQLIHWGGVLIALLSIYEFWEEGRFTDENSALVILIAVALATFLDGMHIGWRFYLAGIFLFMTADIVAYVRSVTWLVILIAIPVIILGLYWQHHDVALISSWRAGKQR